MTTFYVSTLGSDLTGDGTISNPFLSITKAVNVINNSDTISLLPGTYNIYSIINITKSVTITGPNATINGSDTVFNIQANNVTITNITIESSSLVNPVISIDRNSDGTIFPTFYTGNNITYCTLRYTVKCLLLNGNYNITNNTFGRCTGSSIVNVITIYSSRGICNISNNSLTDSELVRYFIYFTSIGINASTHFAISNSKIGTLNIQNNTITLNKFDLSITSSIIYQDYFNLYTVGSSTETYNINTKLNMTISNNIVTSAVINLFINILINSAINMFMFGMITINNNTNNSTTYGIIHFNKIINSLNITVSNTDQNRSIFKIYNNTLHSTFIKAYTYAFFDAGDNSTILNINSLPCSIGENISFVTNKGTTPNITLTPNISTQGPTYQLYNGFKSIYFISDINNSYLTYNANILETLVFSYVIVFTINSNANNGILLSYGDNAAMEYIPSSGGSTLWSNGNNTDYSITSNISYDIVYIVVMMYGITNITYNTYRKNTNTSTVNTRGGFVSTPSKLYLGNTSFNATFGGNTAQSNIFEYQIYNKELEQSEIDIIVAGLRIKYDAILT